MGEERGKLEEQDTRMASAHLQERRELRYEVPIEVEISGLDRSGQVYHERTFTKDVSEWGCGFTASVELKVDDIVAISLVAGSHEGCANLPTSLFQVVRVVPEGEGWLVGAWKMNNEKMWGTSLEEIIARMQKSQRWPELDALPTGDPAADAGQETGGDTERGPGRDAGRDDDR
jgi:hypothetical protein